MIEIRELTKSYGALRVLDGIDLNATPGELIALLGSNGAGKSTLMQCILGITGFEGHIEVDGLDVARHGMSVRARVGYMPQAGSLHSDMTAGETVAFYGSFRDTGDASVESVLEEVELAEVAGRLVGELSGGMQQRLSFAIARLGNPPVLLLDEPTASLDRRSRQILIERLRGLTADGTCVLISTHVDRELAGIATRVVRLEDGRIEGTFSAVGDRTEAVVGGAR